MRQVTQPWSEGFTAHHKLVYALTWRADTWVLLFFFFMLIDTPVFCQVPFSCLTCTRNRNVNGFNCYVSQKLTLQTFSSSSFKERGWRWRRRPGWSKWVRCSLMQRAWKRLESGTEGIFSLDFTNRIRRKSNQRKSVQKRNPSPGLCGSVGWASSHAPRDC